MGSGYVTTAPQVVGFHHYSLAIDGAVVADPATRTFFGSGCHNSAIEVPNPQRTRLLQPERRAARGERQQRYLSKVTGTLRRAYVYTPPDYDTNAKMKYPVLYLLHGWGENEQGWHDQGQVDVIMDNLIARKGPGPTIIVMDNLNAVKPGESASLYFARGASRRPFLSRRKGPALRGRPSRRSRARRPRPVGELRFQEMMLTDLMPMAERSFRRPRPGEPRMAGLSMGGAQTSARHWESRQVRVHRRLQRERRRPCGFDPKTSNGGVFADAAAFNKKVKVLFLGIGSAEGPGTKTFSEQLTQAGIKNTYYESPGTAHEWLTWRRCFKEFVPRLFR